MKERVMARMIITVIDGDGMEGMKRRDEGQIIG